MQHNVLQIAKKELSGFFSSLTAFIFFGTFLAAVLFKFFWMDSYFTRNIADVRPMFEAMPLLLIFLVSAVTMRMWSEERRSGTLELLLTAPMRNAELVFGKFFACLALVGIALALTFPLPLMVSIFLGSLDWGPVFGGYVASMFLASAYIAIGLFVSSRTENQIVSLLVTILFCGFLLLLGSDVVTGLFGQYTSEILKLVGCGSRFNSITRGVVDFRDLYYYVSVAAVFLCLNVLNLEKLRWAGNLSNERHRSWSLLVLLLVANFVVGNFWLQQIGWARLDLTDGQMYSLSPATSKYLSQLQEPLLIRGYFSKKTHLLLAPLIPQLKDLLKEYAIAGNGKVHVEFIDPQENADVEKEANLKYGIKPVALQTNSKYQAAITNSYFDVLVKYGDQFEHLSFKDLIEMKSHGQRDFLVELRNPEYDITNAIRKVSEDFRSTTNLFDNIDKPIKFVGYVSKDSDLPTPLLKLKEGLTGQLETLKKDSKGKFTYEFIDPSDDGGKVAKKIEEEYGHGPMSLGLLDAKHFYFYLHLIGADKDIPVPLHDAVSPSGVVNSSAINSALSSTIKRFCSGFMKTVGLLASSGDRAEPGVPADERKDVSVLKGKLQNSYQVTDVDVSSGKVGDEIDVLLVISPRELTEKQLFAIDQYLMKGGSVIFVTSEYTPSFGERLMVTQSKSGLEDWLQNIGLNLKPEMVLDKRSFPIPVPVKRNINGYTVEEQKLVPFPYFVDVRRETMTDDALTAGIDDIIMEWTSPIEVDKDKNAHRKVIKLLQSSKDSWTTQNTTLTPDFKKSPGFGYVVEGDVGQNLLAVVVEGSFDSFFKGKKVPDIAGAGSSFLEKSPTSARVFLYGSSCFVGDRLLYTLSQSLGSSYTKPTDLIQNSIDWSLQDRDLLMIRGRGHFARTLRPLDPNAQLLFEYFNYALCLIVLAIVWFARGQLRAHTLRKYESLLGGTEPLSDSEKEAAHALVGTFDGAEPSEPSKTEDTQS